MFVVFSCLIYFRIISSVFKKSKSTYLTTFLRKSSKILRKVQQVMHQFRGESSDLGNVSKGGIELLSTLDSVL